MTNTNTSTNTNFKLAWNVSFTGCVIILLAFLFTGCSTKSPPQNIKSPLGYLHGKHYKRGPVTINQMNIPTGFQSQTQITGKLYYKEGEEDIPLAQRKVFLFHKGRQVAQTRTNEKGWFEFKEDIEHGLYTLYFRDNLWQVRKPLEIDQYQVLNLQVEADSSNE